MIVGTLLADQIPGAGIETAPVALILSVALLLGGGSKLEVHWVAKV